MQSTKGKKSKMQLLHLEYLRKFPFFCSELRHSCQESPPVEKSLAVTPSKCSNRGRTATAANKRKRSATPTDNSKSSKKKRNSEQRRAEKEATAAVLNNHIQPVVKVSRLDKKPKPTATVEVSRRLSSPPTQHTLSPPSVHTIPAVDDRACFDSLEELTRKFEDFEKGSQGSLSQEYVPSQASVQLESQLQIPSIIQIDNRSSTPILHIPSPPRPAEGEVDEAAIAVSNISHDGSPPHVLIGPPSLDRVQSCPSSPAGRGVALHRGLSSQRRGQPPSAPATPRTDPGGPSLMSSLAEMLGSRSTPRAKRQDSMSSVASRKTPLTSPSTSSHTSSPLASPPSTPLSGQKKLALKGTLQCRFKHSSTNVNYNFRSFCNFCDCVHSFEVPPGS